MADRTSAELFAMMFESVASGKPLDAKTLWNMSQGYDFSPYQMGCDSALKKLGLMWKCPKCEVFNYGPPKESDECSDCNERRP